MSIFTDYPAGHQSPCQAVTTEDGKATREVENLMITVINPLSGWPIPGSNWDMPGLNKYAEQLLSGENPSDFKYTYGERLTTYPDTEGHYAIDQIDSCIELLKKHPETRRAIAITWVPDWDEFGGEVPCLQLLDFLIRGGKLNCTAVFRSQDILRAWPCNVYGIGRLMAHIGDKVGIPVGSLTTISCSAHIYEN
jgi:thymidylate synthase